MRSDGVEEARRLVGGNSKSGGGGSNLKVLIENRCLASLALNDVVRDHRDGARRFSYQKLPQLQNLKLSVLKLDGSAFEVQIAKNATIAELKMAIEEVFGSSPKEGQDKISWSLVWGHFCLCYEGQKLINDKAQIQNYGIKEGDQLQFIRHMTMDYSPCKNRPKKETIACKKNLRMLPSGSNACEEMEQIDVNACDTSNGIDWKENQVPQFKMAHFLRGLISYSKLWGVSKTGSSSSSSSSNYKTMKPTRFALQLFGT